MPEIFTSISQKLKLNFLGIKFSIKIPHRLYIKILYNYIWKKAKGCSEVYILLTTSGEIYLLSQLLRNIIEPKQILFVATKKYHVDVLKLFMKDVNCVYIPEAFALYNENDYKTIYKGKIFNKFLTKSFIADLFNNWRTNKNEHYITLIKNHINHIKDFDNSKPETQFTVNVKENLETKIKQIDLNKDKFVIFAPEAKTCTSMTVEFWRCLYEKFVALGYEVYTNSIGKNNEYSFAKHTDLSIPEVNLLAGYSKGIIALRSGLCEPFTLIDVPMFVLYTDIKLSDCNLNKVASKTALSTYTLKEYPYITENNLFEYDVNLYSEEGLIQRIIDDIIGGE